MHREGDTLTYICFFDFPRKIRVLEKHEDVKDGKPGFSGVVVSGEEKGVKIWGYDYQIVEIERIMTNKRR